MLTGLTALSVESATTCDTPVSMAASTTCWAPRTLVWTASNGLYSHAGTCFMAAACTTMSAPRMARVRRLRLRMSPTKNRSCG